MALLIAIGLVLGLPRIILMGGVPAEQLRTVTVSRGDTLWEIAAVHGPDRRDLRAVVHRIRRLNNLDSATIRPGQVLRVPAR